MRTITQGNPPIGIEVNWDDLDDDNKDINQIELDTLPEEESKFELVDGSFSGTQIEISGLRQMWDQNDIKELVQELSIITPPFIDVSDFIVTLINDIDPLKTDQLHRP